MDRNQVRNRILIALLAVLAVCLMLLIVKEDIPSTNKQRVVLDMLGCQAARRLGVNVTVSDADSCVLDERISRGWRVTRRSDGTPFRMTLSQVDEAVRATHPVQYQPMMTQANPPVAMSLF